MNEIIRKIEEEQLKAEAPEFRVGDTVKVYGKIKEGNRERIQVFEGVVLKKQGGSSRATFTVRKNSSGIGVEKTWPLHSPNVETVSYTHLGMCKRRLLQRIRLYHAGPAKGTVYAAVRHRAYIRLVSPSDRRTGKFQQNHTSGL